MITIVVLLILAGITIAMLTGNNSILKQATNAKEETIIGQEKEQVEIAYVSAAINKLGDNVTDEDLQGELDKSVGITKTLVTPNDDETLNVLFNDTQHNYNVNKGTVAKVDKEVVPEGMVARIGTDYYNTLNEAISNVPSNGTETTVVLLTNITEDITIEENKNVILNLNNYTMTKEDNDDLPIITINGSLTLKNGIITGNYSNFDVENYVQDYDLVYVNGILNVASCTLSSSQCTDVILVNESASANIGENTEIIVSDNYYEALGNFGGTITTNENTTITSTGGSVGVAIYNDNNGTITINGGTISWSNNFAIFNISGTISINGGSVSNVNGQVICNTGTLNISGGNISVSDDENSGSVIILPENSEYNPILNITGGDIVAKSGCAIVIGQGSATINGNAKISNNSTSNATILNYGTLTISSSVIVINSGNSSLTISGAGIVN